MKLKHPALTIKASLQPQICADIDDLRFREQYPDVPTYKTLAIQGLKIFEAFYCPDCLMACKHQDTIVRHHRLEHPLIPKPSSWPTGRAQRFTEAAGVSRRIFRISGSQTLTDPGTFDISSIFKDMEATQKAFTPNLDVRNITPWLRITKWHEMIEGHDVSLLRSLVSYPTEDEFPILQKAVLSMLMDASDLIEETTTLILQLLNSPDPAKECVLS